MNTFEHLKLYRKRYFPNEIVYLKDDEILSAEKNRIITRWTSLHPRTDIFGGVSVYVMDKNWKISRMVDEQRNLVHWYCDIIMTEKNKEQTEDEDAFIFTDLLIDIIVDPDGTVHVVDMDELGDYIQNGTIDPDTASLALHAANDLLIAISDGEFACYRKMLEAVDI